MSFVAENPEQLEQAVTSFRQITRALAELDYGPVDAAVTINGTTVPLPVPLVRELATMLGHLADGKSVSIVPRYRELTTQEAADILNVSRPYLVRQLEAGKIAFHMVGSHRRVILDNLLKFQEKATESSQQAMQELADAAQDMELLN